MAVLAAWYSELNEACLSFRMLAKPAWNGADFVLRSRYSLPSGVPIQVWLAGCCAGVFGSEVSIGDEGGSCGGAEGRKTW